MHSKKQITQIAGSITRFGFNVPVLLDREDRIIAGHGRIEAAKEPGLEKVPTILIEHPMLAVSACSPAGPTNKATSLADAAKGSERISTRHFGRQTVPCREPDAMARALLELTSRDLADDTRTRVLDHESDRVQLKDGSGQIVVIVYFPQTSGR